MMRSQAGWWAALLVASLLAWPHIAAAQCTDGTSGTFPLGPTTPLVGTTATAQLCCDACTTVATNTMW
jgi:hypothetical protein